MKSFFLGIGAGIMSSMIIPYSTYAWVIHWYTDAKTQGLLDQLNTDYRLNAHIVVLNEWDACIRESSFALCAVQDKKIAGDLVFVINVPGRRFESVLSDNIKPALNTADLKSMEERFVPEMRAGSMNQGIIRYLEEAKTIITQQCQTFSISPCHILWLQKTISDKQALEKQAEAESLALSKTQQAAQTKRITLYVSIIILIVWLSYRLWIQYLYSLDKKRINDLHKTISTIILTVKHDSNLFAEGKKQLQHDLKELLSDTEQVLAFSPSSLHSALSKGNNHSAHTLWTRTDVLMKQYTDMTHIISKTDDIAKDKKFIHSVNL